MKKLIALILAAAMITTAVPQNTNQVYAATNTIGAPSTVIVTVVEGNYNSSVHWGREITRSELKTEGFYVDSRY